MRSSAFVGVSLDSSTFTREWIQLAIPHILSKHDDLQFVLADGLLTYNKLLASHHVVTRLDFSAAANRIDKRRGDVYKLLLHETSRLQQAERSRISIATWDDYCDPNHASIARALAIAYSAIPEFRQCVRNDADAHLLNSFRGDHGIEISRRLCASYVLEETAMIIRITELSERPFDYYPGKQIQTLEWLYEDRFADAGLTVEALIGHAKTRRFNALLPAEE